MRDGAEVAVGAAVLVLAVTLTPRGSLELPRRCRRRPLGARFSSRKRRQRGRGGGSSTGSYRKWIRLGERKRTASKVRPSACRLPRGVGSGIDSCGGRHGGWMAGWVSGSIARFLCHVCGLAPLYGACALSLGVYCSLVRVAAARRDCCALAAAR